MNKNNKKYEYVNVDYVLNTAGDEFNSEYILCETQIDKDKFRNWTNQYFDNHIFISSVSGKAIVLTPYEDIEEYENEDGEKQKRVIKKYDYSSLKDFKEMKIDNNYSTKEVNRNTQKQEFKRKTMLTFGLVRYRL